MMNKGRVVSLCLAVSLAGAMVAGCGSSTSGDSGNSSTQSGGSTSGTLTVAVQADATKLDPALGTDIPSANVYYGKIFEGLVTQDQNMKVVPVLATDWTEVNSTTYEFNLRQGVKFQDGTPFNAEAVKKTFERILDPKTASPR
jgi:peptide/nickel transport system substrate-binding protein